MHRRLLPALLTTAAALAGCALQNPPSRSDLQQQAMPQVVVPEAWKATAGAAQPVADRWLDSFADPALSALVAEALRFNADLQTAAARVEQAGSYLKLASAPMLPSVGLAGLWSGAASSGGSGINGVFLNASLELDVWGRLRYGEAAAQAQSAATEADYVYAGQSLTAMVAKGWFIAIEAGQQRELLQDTLRSAEALQRLAQERQRVGSGNELAVAEARAYAGSVRDSLRQAELSREQALRALEALLGRYPAAEVTVARQLPALPQPVPVGLPSQLLERRPDVVAAERRVATAFNRVGESKAAMLPRISLTAGGSSISSEVFVLQDRTNPSWGLGANLLAPLYQGGALRAQVDVRNAEQKAAIAAYAGAGQRAFAEVENALAAEFALRERAAILEALQRDNQLALELTRVQVRVGSADLRAVEQRQLALYAAQATSLRVRSEQLAQRVNLHLALGGSFDDTPAIVSQSPATPAP